MGTVSMQGYSSTSAPKVRKRSDRVPARSLGRVTTIFFPLRGSASNQSKDSARAHTGPTMLTAGLSTPLALAVSGSAATVALNRRWPGVVPRSTMAAGVAGSMPAPTSPAQMSGRLETPMRKTRVPLVRTSASKSMSRALPARAWPVTM